MSESASTSSSVFSGSLVCLSPFLLCGSGDAKVLRGVDPLPLFGVLREGDVGCEPGVVEALHLSCNSLLSARRFSNVPKSVRPLSSSLRSPSEK
jgi:hypothetical protein